jgi:hypothetical protein
VPDANVEVVVDDDETAATSAIATSFRHPPSMDVTGTAVGTNVRRIGEEDAKDATPWW